MTFHFKQTIHTLLSLTPALQVMEELSNVAILVTHSSSPTASSTLSALGSLSQAQPAAEEDTSQNFQQKQAADSLIQVIEKLSKIVEKRPQHQFTLTGQKKGMLLMSSGGGSVEGTRSNRGSSPYKRIKRNFRDDEIAKVRLDVPSLATGETLNKNSVSSTIKAGANNHKSCSHKRTVACYQCSLCPYLSQTLPLLKEHLKQHNEQHADLILMCSKCRFTSRDQEQLEAHVRQHFNSSDTRNSTLLDLYSEDPMVQDGNWTGGRGSTGAEVDSCKEPPQKKWYCYEEYGLYRCLICSYVCGQQRMLKTHAWKHAGLVDCSYPIFEDEDGVPTRREAQTSVNAAETTEKIVVLQDKASQNLPNTFKLQLFSDPIAGQNKQDLLPHPVSNLVSHDMSKSLEETERVYPLKVLTSEEPVVEVQVKTEVDSVMDQDSTLITHNLLSSVLTSEEPVVMAQVKTEVASEMDHDSTLITDSLLSSAQKIINSSPNSAGHINVIVERLPSTEHSVMATNPLLLIPDEERDKSLLYTQEEVHHDVGVLKDGLGASCSAESPSDSQLGGNIKSVTVNSDSSHDENIPPAGRKRTHSESLRLHSLAAEALVTMPMRTLEVPPSTIKLNVKTIAAQMQSQTTDQKHVEDATGLAKVNLELHNKGRDENIASVGLGEGDEEGPATKAGISLSLLTVIERLRERSDQNASDEDILKELQDNAQFQNGTVAGVIAGKGVGGYVCNIPGMDGLVASPDGNLVDYIPGSERPYMCRLCQYSSSNKGYIKQHLRVHRQRQPYQCPICEHIALDSKDLESHMIHHCKTRTYQCKLCPDSFHYKVRTCQCIHATF